MYPYTVVPPPLAPQALFEVQTQTSPQGSQGSSPQKSAVTDINVVDILPRGTVYHPQQDLMPMEDVTVAPLDLLNEDGQSDVISEDDVLANDENDDANEQIEIDGDDENKEIVDDENNDVHEDEDDVQNADMVEQAEDDVVEHSDDETLRHDVLMANDEEDDEDEAEDDDIELGSDVADKYDNEQKIIGHLTHKNQ